MSSHRAAATAALTLVLAGCSWRSVAPTDFAPRATTRQLRIAGQPMTVEVAATEAEQRQGLSGRASLRENSGMLFVFDDSGVYEFWMKDMRFALDFLWLWQGRVVEVTPNVPPPSPTNPDPIRVRPGQSVDMVLEVPSGWAASHGVAVGSAVEGLPSSSVEHVPQG